jgi:hypothetical protein
MSPNAGGGEGGIEGSLPMGWLSPIWVFFLQRSLYHRKATANSYVAMVGTTPYKLFLKVSLPNKPLASSNFIYRTRKKAACAKSGKE